MKKSNNFKYFTQGDDPREKRKSVRKKVLYWIKLLFYIFLFGLTMTGCVQAFVIKNSYNVGNGIEFYKSKDHIAPRVNTFINKSETVKIELKDKEEKEFTLTQPVVDPEDNVFINYQIKSENDLLKAIRKQTETNGGEYGVWNKFITSVNMPVNEVLSNNGYITGIQEEPIVSREVNGEKRYLFFSETQKTYKYLADKTKDIYVLAFDFAEKAEPTELTYKNAEGKEQTVTVKYQDKPKNFLTLKTEAKTETDSNGKETEKKVNFVNANGNFEIENITGVQKVEFVDGLQGTLTNARNAFARDVLQVYYLSTFGVGTEYARQLGAAAGLSTPIDPTDWFKHKINIWKANNFVNMEISPVEYTLINVYQNVISKWLVDLRYFNQQNPENIPVVKEDQKFDPNINVLKSQNVSAIALSGDYAIAPVTNWGEAWGYGPFYGLLVYPISILIQSLRQAMPVDGINGWASIIAIIIAVVITRLISLAITFKTTIMQQVSEELKYKKAAIEAKYKGLENNKAMKMRKQQEIQALYSKYNINPLDQFGTMILSMPLFLAMWRVIQSIPEIKQTEWLGVNFASISYQRLFAGNWVYLWILVATVVLQLLSMYIPQFLNKKKFKRRTTIAEAQALKKSEKTQKIMMLVFTVITLMFSAGVQVYWIFGSIWTIIQAVAIHKFIKTKWFKEKILPKYTKKS
ncbi:membrane protein insertase YidC [Mycoplasma sp. Pen4]|uniref:membrane protein insertase YidC n=1 Tax=Mycoplasma sp. Pen4 TaxID=640330 RepID=UPI0016546FEA|nr:membrane protein insertase YidC [Mycoplasma sp. Pen4]QNM93656.1 membrane protein insertase YidC [Mycoplasma sp. Pen4]